MHGSVPALPWDGWVIYPSLLLKPEVFRSLFLLLLHPFAPESENSSSVGQSGAGGSWVPTLQVTITGTMIPSLGQRASLGASALSVGLGFHLACDYG